MRVVGYARVSTDQQADRGVSLEAQQTKIRLHAELHDLELLCGSARRSANAPA